MELALPSTDHCTDQLVAQLCPPHRGDKPDETRVADVSNYVRGHAGLAGFLDFIGYLPLTVATVARTLELSGKKGAELGQELDTIMQVIRDEPIDEAEQHAPDKRHLRGLRGTVRLLLRRTVEIAIGSPGLGEAGVSEVNSPGQSLIQRDPS